MVSTMIAFAVAVILTMKSTNMVSAECVLYLVTLVPITIFVVMKLSLLLELERNVRESTISLEVDSHGFPHHIFFS